jgi:two-component system, chemotaxis family, response regulator PixG
MPRVPGEPLKNESCSIRYCGDRWNRISHRAIGPSIAVTREMQMQSTISSDKDAALKLLLRHLHQAVQQQRSGQIELHNSEGRIWHIHLYLGRLLWVIDRPARLRRWQRFLRLYPVLTSPQVVPIAEHCETDSWEYLTILELVKLGFMGRELAIEIIQAYSLECLFDILFKIEDIRAISWLEAESDIRQPITAFDSISTLIKAQQAIKTWNSQGLSQYSPNDIPQISDLAALHAQMTPNTYQSMSLLLTQNLSLRELAAVVKQPVQSLSLNLLIYIDQQAIEIRDADSAPKPLQAQSLQAQSPQTQSLQVQPPPAEPSHYSIFCVDDNVKTCEQLGQVVTGAGHRYTSLQDPIHAIPLLLETQPDLIFLDLIMPITSGYELCAQIRRISTFRTTPILILTGNDGIVDRVRAKVVGATDYLTKPVAPDKLLAAIDRHLVRQNVLLKS